MKLWTTIFATLATLPCWSVHIDVATMSIGERYQEITYPSYENKLKYCESHGYPFHVFTESLDESRPIPWSKIKIIEKLFENPDCEWVFWTDADSLIMNPKIKLNQFIDERYDMITASDFNGINTGQFFIKNCKWSHDFLARIYAKEQFINHGWWEQMSIMDEFFHNKKDRRHLKILNQRRLNSYAPELYDNKNIYWHTGDFIIHFAGVRDIQLRDFMLKYSQITH